MTTPFLFQLQDVRKLHQMGGRGLLAWTMGLGKSFASLLYAYRHPKEFPIVIICPAGLKWNWEREASKHFGMRAEVLSGLKPPPRGFGIIPHISIVNYDILSPSRHGPGWVDFLKKIKPQLIILDESHYLGSSKTARTKSVKRLCNGVPNIIALSGTPLTNRPAELFPTLNILRPDLFSAFMPYAHRYCGPKRIPWGNGWDFRGASNLDELHAILINEGIMLRRTTEEVLSQLPRLQRRIVPLELSNYKEYNLAHHNFIEWLKMRKPGKAPKAEQAEKLTRGGYLKQLAAELKLPAVIDWIEDFHQETDEKLINFCIHKKIISRLKEAFKGECVVVDGSVTGKKRQNAIDWFLSPKGPWLLLGNLHAAGVGWNGEGVRNVAITEYWWAPGVIAQGEKRIEGIGRGVKGEHSISTHLIGKGTIEEKICELTQRKQHHVNAVLDGEIGGEDFDVFDELCRQLKGEKP